MRQKTREQQQVADNLIDYFQTACESSLIVPIDTYYVDNDLVMQWDCHKPVKMTFTVKPDGTTTADTIGRFGCTFSHTFTSSQALALRSGAALPTGITSCIRDLR